ncbi:hypothetical protein C5167_008367 [Papaver somniferum]|uniref:Uncharacterized protein n=1 Tax=Papaver somniferum TaxID=3469 RepID=A0A4Y7JVR8_PAPSO|nr:hypothetical protein C5167_008367 [Papaver somniferum]
MENELISNAILKHYSSSPTSSGVERKSNEITPLTISDKVTHDCHVGFYIVFKPPIPSNEVLKDALSKVLVHYPHLAGRFLVDNLGGPCIVLNNAGVRIVETYFPDILAGQLPFDTSKDSSHLLLPVKGVKELCQIQLNRYACGGLVLGFTVHHRVADGLSIFCSFFVSWSRMVRGLDIPYHDRFTVSQPRNPPRVEFDHGSIEFKKTTINLDITKGISSSSLETVIINYPIEFINKLKVMVNNNPDQRYSTHMYGRRYFKSFIDFGAVEYQGGELQETIPELGSSLCPNLEVDSCLGFPIHDIGFGSGSPCAIIHPNSPFEGLLVFTPACTEDGGVDVKLTLFAKHVSLFKKIAHSVDTKLSCSSL